MLLLCMKLQRMLSLSSQPISCLFVFVYNCLSTLCGFFVLYLLRKARGCCVHVFFSYIFSEQISLSNLSRKWSRKGTVALPYPLRNKLHSVAITSQSSSLATCLLHNALHEAQAYMFYFLQRFWLRCNNISTFHNVTPLLQLVSR